MKEILSSAAPGFHCPLSFFGYPEAPVLGSGDFEADAREAALIVEEVRRVRGSIPRLRIRYNSSESNEKIPA
jgi:hypothetical protein